jgi:hypothetical protein
MLASAILEIAHMEKRGPIVALLSNPKFAEACKLLGRPPIP